MPKTEKVMVNLNVVALGKIDLLIEQGFYSNRTDLIKTAVRNQIDQHVQVVDQLVTESSYSIGIRWINRNYLEQLQAVNKMLDITQIGLLKIEEDVDKRLALKTINSIKIRGVFTANDDVADALKNRMI